MAERFNDEPRTGAAEVVLWANQMAKILGIPIGSFTGREIAAFGIMSHLYSMARLQDHAARRRFGIEIMSFTNRVLPIDDPSNAQFWQSLRGIVITMQEMPA